ncbi:MAG: hypothetical protein JO257_34870, partial [Deltaproteobacteria bacterium]|nr:hypothetical protein [Deltaproteobacteria bacterium]
MKRALLILAACGADSHPRTVKVPFAADEPAKKLAAASQGGDVAAIRATLGPTVIDGGLWFDDAGCERDFGAATEITGPRIDAFATCLAKLGLQVSKQREYLDDLALFNYGPGIEVEARLVEQRLRWIGFAGVLDPNDRAVAITQDALETLRDAGEPNPPAAAGDFAWMRVCIDPMGAIATTDMRLSSTLDAARTYEAAVRG